MAQRVTADKILNMLSEKTLEHHRLLKRGIEQRRNGMEDLYGQPFIVYGDAGNPAEFYISISPDYIYLERYAFKFVIEPYQTTVTGGTESATVTVNNRSLVTEDANATNPHKHNITPNPHNHTTEPHSHNLISGKSFVHTTSTNWEVWIAGVNVTAYFQEQVADVEDGWLGDKGEGIYPNASLEETENRVIFYDVLDVASVLDAEGNITSRDKLLRPELKRVQIKSDAPFGIQAYLYLKYSNVNR